MIFSPKKKILLVSIAFPPSLVLRWRFTSFVFNSMFCQYFYAKGGLQLQLQSKLQVDWAFSMKVDPGLSILHVEKDLSIDPFIASPPTSNGNYVARGDRALVLLRVDSKFIASPPTSERRWSSWPRSSCGCFITYHKYVRLPT